MLARKFALVLGDVSNVAVGRAKSNSNLDELAGLVQADGAPAGEGNSRKDQP